eukprot:CCRYP_000238-RA/>CCRYP_000238-RA protein AED:0.33 eAED:0.32 QI:0/0/0/1/0.66/0.5/4/0/340
MTCKSKAHEALGLLFAREGVPPKMIVDSTKEMKMGEFARKCKEAHCYLRSTEPYSPWSNSAEREIRELKKGAAWKMTWSGAPKRLWCFAVECESYVRSHTAHDIYRLYGPFCEFGFWNWVKFRDQGFAFPGHALVLGKYLGPSIDVGPAMTSRVVKANGEIEDRSRVRALTAEERELARVLRQKRDADGKAVSTAHHNPALDTHVYEVWFPERRTEELAANVIAKAVYAQCDADRNQYFLLDVSPISARIHPWRLPGMIRFRLLMKIVKHSNCSWESCCEWKDGNTSWQKLPDLKESHPLQVAEFMFAVQIADEPAFNWWVSWVLKKRDQIISLVKCRSA